MNDKPYICLITGASSGIGRAIAEVLAGRGDIVYAGARKDADIEALSEVHNVNGIKLDVCNPDDIHNAVSTIEKEHGYLDCLVNCAGLMGWGAVIDRDMEYFRKIFEVNMWGTVAMSKAVYPLMKKSPHYPGIFNISSQGANYTLPFWSPYHISKFAQEAFSGSLRQELMPEGIRVFSIAPGAFKSDMLAKQKDSLNKYREKYNSVFAPRVLRMLDKLVNKDSSRGLPPEIVGRLVHKVLHGSTTKARFEPGKRFIPDMLLQRMPMFIVDKLIKKIMK